MKTKESIKKELLSKLPSTNVEAFKLLIEYIDVSIQESVEKVFSEE